MTNPITQEMRGVLTQERALEIAHSNWWVDLPATEVALAQLRQERLCMPFDVFQEAVEKAVGYGVFTHEFGSRERMASLAEEIEQKQKK